eukprot:TRINITY_DN16932_c0_g1_i3.p1 TRINITY_DN16932_c0_g1~~TRINITY_DN16932_c0_g1_i3.p1  ORF type:complete len:368 (+),score=34.50 TRINITY_DN16932_c0_g1_i3:1107-2210(+)
MAGYAKTPQERDVRFLLRAISMAHVPVVNPCAMQCATPSPSAPSRTVAPQQFRCQPTKMCVHKIAPGQVDLGVASHHRGFIVHCPLAFGARDFNHAAVMAQNGPIRFPADEFGTAWYDAQSLSSEFDAILTNGRVNLLVPSFAQCLPFGDWVLEPAQTKEVTVCTRYPRDQTANEVQCGAFLKIAVFLVGFPEDRAREIVHGASKWVIHNLGVHLDVGDRFFTCSEPWPIPGIKWNPETDAFLRREIESVGKLPYVTNVVLLPHSEQLVDLGECGTLAGIPDSSDAYNGLLVQCTGRSEVTLCHELGHWLGLTHTSADGPNNIMYATAPRPLDDLYCSQEQRVCALSHPAVQFVELEEPTAHATTTR